MAKELGYGYSVVLGSSEYYPKFGYLTSVDLGIESPFEVPKELFMAIKFDEKAEDIAGIMEYSEEFS